MLMQPFIHMWNNAALDKTYAKHLDHNPEKYISHNMQTFIALSTRRRIMFQTRKSCYASTKKKIIWKKKYKNLLIKNSQCTTHIGIRICAQRALHIKAKVFEIMTAVEFPSSPFKHDVNCEIQWLVAPEFFSRQRSHATLQSTSHRR